MRKKISILAFGGVFFVFAGNAQAIPMDLSAFNVSESVTGSVTESGGEVDFIENSTDAVLYFYNDTFDLASDVTTLSFDYDFTLGDYDVNDYIQFNINFIEQWYTASTGSGHIEIDLTPYQGQTISLDWALVWDFDTSAGTIATISNIDIASGVAPIPEPATIFLFTTGLAGIYGYGRKMKFLSKS